jgi:hypothetical protein
MLNISKALSSGQAQTYHKLEFTAETANYYKQDGAVQGQWQGQLAEKMGLRGAVTPEEFARLTEGRHPQTDEQMVQHREAQEYKNPDGSTTKAVEHRAGWDATFSAPKSVSLTALVGGDERVGRPIAKQSPRLSPSLSGIPRRGSAGTTQPRPPADSLPPSSSMTPPARSMATLRPSSIPTPSSST